MSDDIVVVGKRNSAGDIYGYSQLPPGRAYQPRMPEDGGDDADFSDAIYVRVHVKNQSDMSAAIAAAQQLASAIARVKTILENTNATTFTVKGRTYSVADTLANLTGTTWFVNDVANPGNGGVGTASYGSGNGNTDKIYFGVLDENGYASRQFENYAGMNALILHELGHLSQAGFDFFNANIEEYKRRNNGQQSGYYDSPFAKNVEAFANDLMIGLQSAAGINITSYGTTIVPGGETNAVDPKDVTYP